MLFASAFLPMFGIGGLTGIPLAFNAVDLYLHDTYYIIGHFHYVVAPGTIFAIFAGVYYWYPKATGRMMSPFLGKVHFWSSLFFINGIFFPMFLQGMAGVHRRWYDGGGHFNPDGTMELTWQLAGPVLHWNWFMSVAAFGLAVSQIPFIYNFCYSMFKGRKVTSDNPWDATTLEWDTPTPPPHGNFVKDIAVYRGPYEYSVPGAEKDFTPQSEPPQVDKPPGAIPAAAHTPTPAPAH
jgi:cytochrome c oxidase subunit 1